MSRRMVGRDPIEQQIELAFRPGAFIRDGECFSFVAGLDQVAATIDKLITTEPSRAVGLYETFLAGCQAKADELDDSSGSFGQFAQDLICGWIKARQSSGAAARWREIVRQNAHAPMIGRLLARTEQTHTSSEYLRQEFERAGGRSRLVATHPAHAVGVQSQKVMRMANWISRALDATSRICPKVGLPTVVSGSASVARLNALNASARISTNRPSLKPKRLNMPKFSDGWNGPLRLPK